MSSKASPAPSASPKTHVVNVLLKESPSGCCRVSVKPTYKLRVNAGESVMWKFVNGCSKDMDLGVGNFRSSEEYGKDLAVDKPDPFDSQDPRHVKVTRAKPGEFSARAKPKLKEIRSYKYDILDGTTVLLDPEVEIRP
jgi:hypothetical protein